MRIAPNIEVLSVTPVSDGRMVLLLLRDRNNGNQYFYNIPGLVGSLPDSAATEGIFPEN
ncbi:hypothetical protein PSET11_03048 [Arthrobacter ulcerisalmonis]|uniref:Uncharacterized protein n=1 Tax=Arthrobacter ulcerisalmonis TaxID=2483813 RepID=A0A3P5XBV4_9MICC|nr:hypothetical protein PSET11_03048 [Arthrobacter ulcerisalmonis]